MKVYGASICIDCRNYKAIQENRKIDAEYIDITENTTNLKEFLKIRDTAEIFDEVRKNGGIGIPLFVDDDGKMTFDINEAFAWMGQSVVEESEIVERREDTGCSSCK